jgi:hypothetical protein
MEGWTACALGVIPSFRTRTPAKGKWRRKRWEQIGGGMNATT